MEMNRVSNSGAKSLEEMKAIQRKEAEKAQQAKKEEQVSQKKEDDWNIKDEYIKNDPKSNKPTGLYSMGQDENNNPKIIFDDPAKAKEAAPAEECTGNTDQVDREIENLKQEKQKLEQQIARASDDESQLKKLKDQLAAVESELQQKDNDTYRRNNSSFTNTGKAE